MAEQSWKEADKGDAPKMFPNHNLNNYGMITPLKRARKISSEESSNKKGKDSNARKEALSRLRINTARGV